MRKEKALGLALIALGFIGLWLLRNHSPLVRLAAATLGMIWVIKCAAYLWQKSEGAKFHSPLATGLFFLAWPGVSLAGFTSRGAEPAPETGGRFLEAWLCLLAGIAILVTASLIGKGESTAWNYGILLSVFLIVHLGLVEVLADGIRLLGFSPPSLFRRPYLASSLRDFWSLRWNRAFVDMNKLFLLAPLREKMPAGLLVFSLFLLSGLLHEMGISYPDRSSWGRPLLYFAIQGLGMELERRKVFPRSLLWPWIVFPIPLLFTPEFVNLFAGGLAGFIASSLLALERDGYLRYGLIAGGFGHLLVLCASVQVPRKLGWKKEFAKLAPLNRKVFWTYGGYIFAIIVFMALVSFTLSRESSLLSPAAVLWLTFIALFWWARVLTDFLYFRHEDWPAGALFVIGHICLTTLFISLALLYTLISLVLLF